MKKRDAIAEGIMQARFGKDSLIALATVEEGLPAVRTVGLPQVRVVRNGGVLGGDAQGRGIEQVVALTRDAGYHLGCHTAPGEILAHYKQAAGAGD